MSYMSSFGQTYDKLVWADEFDYFGQVNNAKWFHQTTLPLSGGWFNGEQQHYTNRNDNSYVSNGTLKIVAKKELFTDQNVTKQFTSARLNSKFAFKYGKVIFRAKLPIGAGTWPALWMLGKNIDENGAYWDNQGFGNTPWPACGEIDIMEHWGTNQNYIQSAIHTPSSYGATINLGGKNIPTASSEFHVYTLEWSPEKLVFSVDSVIYYTYNPTTKNASTWPFNAEQYLLLNIAIQSSISADFVQSELEVDYIRVYQESGSFITNTERINQVSYYPNPANNQVNINIGNTNELAVAIGIYSIDGKLIKQEMSEIKNNAICITDLEDLKNGLYFISYKLDDQWYSCKLFIAN